VSLDEFRREMEAFWERVDADGERTKDSQLALNELERCYRGLDEGEQQLALVVFTDWILGSDIRRQFAGLAMIDRFSIRAALPSLRELAAIFESVDGPSAPYDWAKVNRIIGRLMSADIGG
jgi:hypothetical protein